MRFTKRKNMIIPIVGLSALEYWLDGTNNYYCIDSERKSLAKKFEFHISKIKAMEIQKEYALSFPIEIMAPEKYVTYKTSVFKLHSYIQGLPYKSFVKLNDRENSDEEVYVASPELCFLQAANELPIYLAAKIGCMLCAKYVRDDEMAMGQRNREPLTSVKKINQFLNNVDRAKGLKKARYAIKSVVDNCNSPMEVNLAVMGKQPISKGGYALGEFEMNGEVILKSDMASFLGRKSCKCDMVWEEEKVVVEYESNMVHLDKNQHEYDKKRSTAIINSGYKIINITSKDVALLSRSDEMFWIIRKTLKQKKEKNKFEKYEDVRFEVYKNLVKKDIFQILKNKKQNNVIY